MKVEGGGGFSSGEKKKDELNNVAEMQFVCMFIVMRVCVCVCVFFSMYESAVIVNLMFDDVDSNVLLQNICWGI